MDPSMLQRLTAQYPDALLRIQAAPMTFTVFEQSCDRYTVKFTEDLRIARFKLLVADRVLPPDHPQRQEHVDRVSGLEEALNHVTNYKNVIVKGEREKFIKNHPVSEGEGDAFIAHHENTFGSNEGCFKDIHEFNVKLVEIASRINKDFVKNNASELAKLAWATPEESRKATRKRMEERGEC